MRSIERSKKFEQDLRKAARGLNAKALVNELPLILSLLQNNQKIPDKYRDHALIGNWKGFRDCHIRPNLVLIYQITEEQVIKLARIGTHAQLKLK